MTQIVKSTLKEDSEIGRVPLISDAVHEVVWAFVFRKLPETVIQLAFASFGDKPAH